jgi:transcriptional regulator with XRE-family HTH domain
VRAARGLTQCDFARLIGISPATLCLLETGKRLPRLDMLLRLARGLRIAPARLLPK